MTAYIILLLIVLFIYSAFANHIPKSGRAGISEGEEIIAEIVNKNRGADRAVTLRAIGGGRRFKVKLKPTEAHLWVKGDNIKVLVSRENKNEYRICFNDYFRDNEKHIKESALELLQKRVKLYMPSAKSIGYTQETLQFFKESKLSSQRIFSFVTMMNMIDSYIAIVSILIIFCAAVYKINELKLKTMLVPALAITIIIWYISSVIKMCTKIKHEAENK